jgi:hypothetical protein
MYCREKFSSENECIVQCPSCKIMDITGESNASELSPIDENSFMVSYYGTDIEIELDHENKSVKAVSFEGHRVVPSEEIWTSSRIALFLAALGLAFNLGTALGMIIGWIAHP